MDKLIERYVWDVTRRLSKQERSEVSEELTSSIYDMLPEGAGEAQVRSVLEELGSPQLLAEKYRQIPRYLISPAMYGTYVRTIARVLPIAGVAFVVIGLIAAVAQSLTLGTAVEATDLATMALSSGFEGVIQVLVWITVGFAIAERSGAAKRTKKWRIDELPALPPKESQAISVADSVIELAITLVFGSAALMVALGKADLPLVISRANVSIVHPFDQAFLTQCVPVIALLSAAGLVSSSLKLAYRRWTPVTCAATVLDSLVSIAGFAYLFTVDSVFSPEFMALIKKPAWLSVNPVLLVAFVVIAAVGICESAAALTKTYRQS